jgi:toxin ParE1/3/4
VSRIVRRTSARRDLVEAYRYYVRKADRRTAERFFARAESTFERLAALPEAGALYDPGRPSLAGLRYPPIQKFPSQIAFYKPIAGGIEVYRVLHGARDLDGILTADFP